MVLNFMVGLGKVDYFQLITVVVATSLHCGYGHRSARAGVIGDCAGAVAIVVVLILRVNHCWQCEQQQPNEQAGLNQVFHGFHRVLVAAGGPVGPTVKQCEIKGAKAQIILQKLFATGDSGIMRGRGIAKRRCGKINRTKSVLFVFIHHSPCIGLAFDENRSLITEDFNKNALASPAWPNVRRWDELLGSIPMKGGGKLAFLDAFVDGGALDRHEHGDTGGRDAHVSLVIQAEVFNPLAAFRVRPLPAVGARAGRRLADNLAQIFRHLDEWKLNKRHISYMVSNGIQMSTIKRTG
jgi:hypothetical protein